MNRKKVLAVLLPSLLLSPAFLARAIQADEVAAPSNPSNLSEELSIRDTAGTELSPAAAAAATDSADKAGGLDLESEPAPELPVGKETSAQPSQGDSGLPESAALTVAEDRQPLDTRTVSGLAGIPAADSSERRVAAEGIRPAAAPSGPQTASDQTVQEAVTELLTWASVSPEQIGSTPQEQLSFAKSLGMVSPTANPNDKVQDFQSMYAVAEKLHAAYRAEKKAPLFLNGKAQPIFPFSKGTDIEHYSYETSDIVRYIVYVETDYDTDGDGKRDLVKTFVQLPKAAVNGDYKAATIFEASPYVAGTTEKSTLDELGLKEGGSFDMKELYSQPEKRQAAGTATTVETAKQTNPKDWYYVNPMESSDTYTHYDYENLNWYNYYLVRGYAVVTSSGLGSRGSDGFNTTGSDLEIAAYKNIIEWLTGKRTAYTDKTSNIAVKADWSNGNVAMTGLSWAGTTTFGVASTGVEGLKTVVPAAGIASWYDYFNSQGSPLDNAPGSDISWLSVYTSGRILDQADWDTIKDRYAAYITALNKNQHKDGYDYNEEFAKRDYTLNAPNLKAAALIIHGLNDDNVKTKHFELMYRAFEQAGQEAKLLLHQGNHAYPSTWRRGTNIDGQPADDLLNRWYSHYLYGVENGVEKIPPVQVQSNLDPAKWESYDSWKTSNKLLLQAYSKREDAEVSSDFANSGVNWTKRNEAASKESSLISTSYGVILDQDMTIKGTIPVHFRAAVSQGEGKDYHVSAALMDVSDQEFEVLKEQITYDENGYRSRQLDMDTLDSKGYWMGSNLENIPLKQYRPVKVNYSVIARGWLNLANPESGLASASAARSIQPKIGDYHDYTMYLQPNVYKVQKGHKLVLALNTYDPDFIYVPSQYAVNFKTDSIRAEIPIVESSRMLRMDYMPNAKDQAYAALPERRTADPDPVPDPIQPVDPGKEEQGPDKAADPAAGSGPVRPIQGQPANEMAFRMEEKALAAAENADPAAVGAGQGQTNLPSTGSQDSRGLVMLGLTMILALLGLKKADKIK